MSGDGEVTSRRIHISGLSHELLDSAELESKFRSFGKVKDAIIVKDTLTGLSKGFGFITVDCNDKDWQRCTSALNGAKWKGTKLKLEPAKPSGLDRLAKEREEVVAEPIFNPCRRPSGVFYSKDMSLMRDELVDSRKKWKKVRYGRAVAELKLRSTNGRLLHYEPTRYQHQLKSFVKKDARFQEIVDSVPFSNLTWSIDSIQEPASVAAPLTHPERVKQISKSKQATSIEQKAELLQQKKAIIQAALSNLDAKIVVPNPNRIVFDSDSEEDTQLQKSSPSKKSHDEDELQKAKASLFEDSEDEKEHQQTKVSLFEDTGDEKEYQQTKASLFESSEDENQSRFELSEESDKETANDSAPESAGADTKFLFGEEEESDDDDEGAAFGIKRVFEGEQGQQRLKMQRRYGNDSRFRMDDQFIDSDEESSSEEAQPETAEEQMEVDFAAEKSKALSVLQDVLGLAPSSTALDPSKKQTGVEWKEMVRYDPDAPDAGELEIDAKELMPASQIKKPVAMPAPAPIPAPQPSLPTVSNEKYFAVSNIIGSLFSKDKPKNEDTLFTFMDSDSESDESPPTPKFFGIEPTPIPTTTAPVSVAAGTSSAAKEPLFFFHLGDAKLSEGCFEGRPVFCRSSPIESLESGLNLRRKKLIRDFKALERRSASTSARRGKFRSR